MSNVDRDELDVVHPDDVPEDAKVLQNGEILHDGETIGVLDRSKLELGD